MILDKYGKKPNPDVLRRIQQNILKYYKDNDGLDKVKKVELHYGDGFLKYKDLKHKYNL